MKFVIMALLTVHGLIHAIGFAGAWGLAEIKGVSPVPTDIVAAQATDPIVRVLGLVWLLALAAFLVAAYLLLVNSPAWRPLALAAVLVSTVPVALWWQNAFLGTLVNTLVVAAVLLGPKLEGVAA
ncbi:MAG TPA: hypothetical protein VFZ45_01415 [Actinomycetota bacterium]|nr:hypothetical protein [Actinomycetota bacterium]